LIVDFVEFTVLEQSLEAVLNLENIGLTFDEHPLCKLQTDLLEINMTQFGDQTEYSLEFFQCAVL